MAFSEHVNAIERRVINRVIANMKEISEEFPGMTVAVEDEEETEYKGPFDATKIRAATGHTGMTTYRIYIEKGGEKIRASALFIHGNDEDVLSDGSWKEGHEWLFQRLEKGASE